MSWKMPFHSVDMRRDDHPHTRDMILYKRLMSQHENDGVNRCSVHDNLSIQGME